jgi:hypothetical protein
VRVKLQRAVLTNVVARKAQDCMEEGMVGMGETQGKMQLMNLVQRIEATDHDHIAIAHPCCPGRRAAIAARCGPCRYRC